MNLEVWGLADEIVDHRVVVRWWQRLADGSEVGGLASPKVVVDQLMAALRVAGHAACIEELYDALVATGRFGLDEIDAICATTLEGYTMQRRQPVLVDDL